MKIHDRVIVSIAAILVLCVVWAGFGYGLDHGEREVVAQTKYVYRYIEKTVYVEVEKPVYVSEPVYIEVEKPIYVEREAEVPVMLKDWNSLEELEEFLANDDTEERVILTAGNDGKINFSGQCEDSALQLRDRAMAINKHLSVIVLHPKEYEKWYGKQLKSNEYHAICMARIGNEFWYIEPATDKHWLALYLD